MRVLTVLLWVLFCAAAPVAAQLSLSFGMPGLSIGINVPVYPQLERVPGYPVYYAPGLQTNFFFYDGLYWVYQGDDWYASDWYDGPWSQVPPSAVPLFILRIPVRYYRSPPTYFSGWRGDAPPRWGDHWGNDWQRQRPGWDRWDRKAVPAPAPLPSYQRPYAAERYPRPDEQRDLRERNYRYQPREAVARHHLGVQPAVQAPAPAPRRPAAAPEQDRSPPRAQPNPLPRREQGRPEQGRPEQGKPEQGRPEQGRPDQGKKDQGKGRDNSEERGGEHKK